MWDHIKIACDGLVFLRVGDGRPRFWADGTDLALRLRSSPVLPRCHMMYFEGLSDQSVGKVMASVWSRNRTPGTRPSIVPLARESASYELDPGRCPAVDHAG